MKPLTSSVFSFEKLRQDGYLYVDKTEYLWKLDFSRRLGLNFGRGAIFADEK